MQLISAVIITYNEERFIGNCLKSLKGIADEIIVVDSYSSDSTEEICRKAGNVRFIQHPFEGFRDQKNYAVSFANHRIILSLDADEALSEELRKSILEVKENWSLDAYRFNRQNHYCGKPIRHCDWYPDRQLRLFDKEKARWGELNLHERVVVDEGGTTGQLKGDLLHWSFSSVQQHKDKLKRYTMIGAEEYHKAGRKAGLMTPYIHLIWGFFRTYLLKGGFLDGRYGFIICSVYAQSAFNKYQLLRQLNKTANNSMK
jgi:glycosyltransferase involved in cell wall biosynthesis